MFRKKLDNPSKPKVDTPNTVIGKGITLESARLTGNESVRIDGSFIGEVDLNGSLILGETGVIEGSTHAKYIVVAGTLRGDISCDTVLHISPTARVDGDIRTNAIIVDEGGQLNGRHHVGDTHSLANPEAQPLLTSDKDNKEKRDKKGKNSRSERSYLEKSLEIVDGKDGA